LQIIADFHIHSKYSRATSKKMDLEQLARNAKMKGLDLLGTGDFTFPAWFEELKSKLNPVAEGVYSYGGVLWIPTTEVATVYSDGGKTRKIHHVIHASNLEVASQVNEALSKKGNLKVDGRPMFSGLTSPELVEMVMGIDKDILIYPAHVWTSWWAAFGSFSGYDSMEDCYKDQTKHIHALETGMSSDPPMNWRLSALDRYTLLSNSDAHSPWIWRIGREANVFEFDIDNVKKLTYAIISEAIKTRKGLKYTIEVEPSYGKYHFTGHRSCGINISPKQAMQFDNKCPKCGRKMTVGVLQRVEQLADRPEGFKPANAVPYKSLLPLYEIISFATGVKQLYNRGVIEKQDELVKRFDNEFNVLLNVPKEQLLQVTKESIANAIIKVREGKVKYIPGYDGVYGQPVFDTAQYEKLKAKVEQKAKEQKRLADFK
jgi:uncharacterized protein (TIGR00375 family)